MALAISASSPPAVTNQTAYGTQTLTTSSFVPPAGSLLLAVMSANPVSQGESSSIQTVSGNTTTWSVAVSYNNYDGWDDGGYIGIAYAFVNTSVSTSVSCTFSYSNDCQLKVYVITGAKNPGPINSTGQDYIPGGSSPGISYTATAAGSVSFHVAQNCRSSSSVSISGTTTDSTLSSYSKGLISHQTTPSSGTTLQSFTISTTGTCNFASGFVEVVPSSAPPGGSSGGGTGSGGLGGGSLNPNTLSLKINGIDRSSYADQTSWSLTQSWGRQGDTATITVIDEYSTTPNFIPETTQTIELKDVTLGIVLFGGVITKPELQVIAPGLNQWVLNCVSYTFWADSRVVSYSYSNNSMGAIIRDLTSNATVGITTNDVVTGPTITHVEGKFEPLSKAWSKVTQMASTETTYGWWVDGNKNLHVTDEATAQSSGVTFTDAPTTSHLNSEGHYESNYKYDWDATQLANRIYVVGGNVPSQQSDHWTGDGRTRSFALTYPLDSSAQIQPALKVGGNTTVVSTQTTDPWYLAQDQTTGLWNLYVGSTTNTPTPSSGTSIDLTYGYVVTEVSIVQNTTSISKYNGGNGGYFDATVADQNLLTLTATNQRGQHEVAEYGYAQEQVTFTTTEDWQGWVNVGQTITFISRYVPDSASGYSMGLNKTFLIVNVQAAGVAGRYRKLQIQAIRVS